MNYYENASLNTALRNSVENEEAMLLVNKHYAELHRKLVKTELDNELFNTTVLSISYRYNPAQDFKEQFIYLFQSNQMREVQETKMKNYLVTDIPENYSTIYTNTEEERTEDEETVHSFITTLQNANPK